MAQILFMCAVVLFAMVSSSSFASSHQKGLDDVEQEQAALVEEARMLAKKFKRNMQDVLVPALGEHGVPAALAVCSVEAPVIAEELAKETGWEIKRVSLKPRNPQASPTPTESAVLRAFEVRQARDEDVKEMEWSALMEDGFYYMKPIQTGKLCVSCHGKEVSSDVKAALDYLYDKDQAVGYRPGDIRGAFSFRKPLPDTHDTPAVK